MMKVPTYCPFSGSCNNRDRCDTKQGKDEHVKLVTSGEWFRIWPSHPDCFEIHTTEDLDDD